jgi:arylsulfatase A-like enzyme
MRSRLLALALLVLAALAGFGLSRAYRVPAPIGVIVITLDTTRADRLSAYGFQDASMPNLDRLAREGVLFDQATSVAPLTLPAHCSLFTGLFPPEHGVRDNADRALTSERTTLAEVLHAQGFRTAAFVGSAVLGSDRGLAQGFDVYRDVDSSTVGPAPSLQRRANEVVDDVIQWLDGVGDSRFFVWAHLYDPHRPYDPPEPYRSIHAANPYVGEIVFADAQIGRLLDALDRRHLLNRTVVIVAGDHGESLSEHGERDHGIFVYESVLRVPLIIRAPSVPPARISPVVRLVDVMPTVLELLDLEIPPGDGVSLIDLMRGRRHDLDLEAYSESMYPQRFGLSPLRALRAGRFKVIDAPKPELYDLERDPFEEHNVYDERRMMAEAFTRRVRTLDRQPARAEAHANAVIPNALQERLAALGYVGSKPFQSTSSVERLPDPKDCIVQKAPASPGVPVPECSRLMRTLH